VIVAERLAGLAVVLFAEFAGGGGGVGRDQLWGRVGSSGLATARIGNGRSSDLGWNRARPLCRWIGSESVLRKNPETGRFSKKNREAIKHEPGNRREGSGV